MQQTKTQSMTLSNSYSKSKKFSLIDSNHNTFLDTSNTENSSKELNNLIKKAKNSFKLKKYLSAKNQLTEIFEKRKNIEIALLISDCFTAMREFKKAVSFFEENLHFFDDNGKYWGILALHNYASEDFEGAAGAAYNAIDKHGLHLVELWKIFVHASKKLERVDVLYHICKKYLPVLNDTSFDAFTTNPYIIEGYLCSCYEQSKNEGWKFIQQSGINIENVEKLGDVAGVICASIASFLPDNEKTTKHALSWLTKARDLDPSNNYIRWNLSHVQLTEGMIDEGISNYETRFLWEKFPSYNRTFKKPKWHPNASKDAKILIWYEQGIGDQIRFLSAINPFKKEFPNLIYESGERTLDFIRNSFDDIEVRKSTMNDDLTTTVEDFDYHIPAGSLFFYMVGRNSKDLRSSKSSIFKPFLITDKLRKRFWAHKLHSQSSKPKIGICWTSEMKNKQRDPNYTSLEKWEKLLNNNKFSFVNLTYSVSMEEIQKKDTLTQNFLDTGFLDQKDDLEGVAALISNLDYVISTSSSPSMFASALGVPTLIFSRNSSDSLGRLEKFSQHPIFKNTKLYPIIDAESDQRIVAEIINFLENELISKV